MNVALFSTEPHLLPMPRTSTLFSFLNAEPKVAGLSRHVLMIVVLFLPAKITTASMGRAVKTAAAHILY